MAAKAKSISGFPEWLPEEKIIENQIIDTAKEIYESHGFVPIETPAVELVETLTAKGVVDKEIYGVHRLAAKDDKEASLGLHFDLTVPFARYVATHFNDLVFPFKRYQLQKVWRGERPQKGRFREFYQFDADIVARDVLPIACDAEVVSVLTKCLLAFQIGTPKILLNNRKLLIGYYEGLGVSGEVSSAVITIVDKLQKIGREGVDKELKEYSLSDSVREDILNFSEQVISGKDFSDKVGSLPLNSALAEEGASELVELLNFMPQDLLSSIEVQLQIARGLDYYTGTIVESMIEEYPEFGSVGSGGRYDGLVSNYLSQNVPGVGFSIGITRLMDLILKNQLKPLPAQSTADVLIASFSEEDRSSLVAYAETLREVGISVEIYPRSPKIGKQIEYASKKGIKHVLFVGDTYEVKNIESGEQSTYADIEELHRKLGTVT